MLKISGKEKAEKFKAIKNEILAMVSSQQVGAANRPEVKEEDMLAKIYKLDSAMEDKLCDLYDLHIQGLSGDKGVEIQRLLIELGDLWPKGVMDHHKLRDAINRAKSRRRVLVDNQCQETDKSDGLVNPIVRDHRRTSDQVPSLKRKVTYSCDSHYLMSSPPGRPAARKAATDHPGVPPITSYPLAKAIKQNFVTERKLKSSADHSPVEHQKEQGPQKNHVKIRFSLKPQHGTPRYEEQAAIEKVNCLRVDAHLTCKQ